MASSPDEKMKEIMKKIIQAAYDLYDKDDLDKDDIDEIEDEIKAEASPSESPVKTLMQTIGARLAEYKSDDNKKLAYLSQQFEGSYTHDEKKELLKQFQKLKGLLAKSSQDFDKLLKSVLKEIKAELPAVSEDIMKTIQFADDQPKKKPPKKEAPKVTPAKEKFQKTMKFWHEKEKTDKPQAPAPDVKPKPRMSPKPGSSRKI